MRVTSMVTDCQWDFIGEGYDPAEAAELCADEEIRRSDEEKEKSGEDQAWEYWYG